MRTMKDSNHFGVGHARETFSILEDYSNRRFYRWCYKVSLCSEPSITTSKNNISARQEPEFVVVAIQDLLDRAIDR